ncbi:hypothetical protein [Tritonibacter mobilis]|uniref:hypothetical protein n=1 Tax=Tritonibacter mobilis TaxID=379347 RepID=UPI000806A7B6|nr:hypothetical protein [Tritonibacter mobilis]
MLPKFGSKITGALCVAAVCASFGAPLHARTLTNPDVKTMALLADFLAGNTPNFRERALKSKEYRYANEFDKPAILKRVEAQLRSEYEGFADVDGITLRVNANIGQYDAENGVYRISIFAPGIYFPYSNYALVMDNAADFHEWKIPVAEARKIREQSPYGDVIVEVTLLPFGVQPNNQRHVRGQITDVKVFEDRSGQLIHSAAIADDQKRDVQVGANAAPTLLDDEAVSVAGLTIGDDLEDITEALEDQGYTVLTYDGGLRFSSNPDRLDTGMGYYTFDGSENPYPYAVHMGPDLDCLDSSQLHSCGVVYADLETGASTSIVMVQNVTGTSKQDLVTTLFAKYGPASDKFNAYLWKKHAVDQYVWGAFEGNGAIKGHWFTEISGRKHWQVEAYVVEPTPQRKSVIVQINKVEGDNAVTGSGGVKF